jgi:UDP-N-acetylglucosamine:LPS N-acetylglucosamine transferase
MKTIAIASAGGHWIQLLRLKPAFESEELIFVSTDPAFAETVKGHRFYDVPDANRWNKMQVLKMAVQVFRIMRREKPDVVISTGAAPGLLGMIAGRAVGAKTVWIDSIANVERLSLSGKLASHVASRTFTQWPHLATATVFYNGNVLG